MNHSTAHVPADEINPIADRMARQRRIAKRILIIFGSIITAFLALVFLVAMLSPRPAAVVVPAPTLGAVPTQPAPIVPPVKVAPEPPRLAEGVFGDGTYEVGEGPGLIAPGKYHYDGGAAMAFWARLKDTTGDMGSTIANGVPKGPTTITVKASDGAVHFMGDAVWTRVA